MSLAGSIVDRILVGSVQLAQLLVPGPTTLGSRLRAPVRRADPVVLVGGFATSPNLWEPWVRSLRADGFEVHVVDVPQNGLGDMYHAAAAVRDAIEGVRRLHGGGKVDVVAFSEGGLLTRMYIAMGGGRDAVDSLVTLASPHAGIGYGGLLNMLSHVPLIGPGVPESALQLSRGSSLIQELQAAERNVSTSVEMTSIYNTHFDGIVYPAASAVVRGARNLNINHSNHFMIVRTNGAAYEMARAALLRSGY
jgi:triacylglycerol esterase/lipase EstA (alpha/beta hydrolase family)